MTQYHRSTYENIVIAGQLVDLKMRIALICEITSVDIKILRNFWQERYNDSPPKGKKTSNLGYYIHSPEEHQKLANFALYWQRCNDTRTVDARLLLDTYQTFVNTTNIRPSIDAAYLFLRDQQKIALNHCLKCSSLHVVVDNTGNLHKCPFCIVCPEQTRMHVFKTFGGLLDDMERAVKSIFTNGPESKRMIDTLTRHITQVTDTDAKLSEAIAFIHVNAAIKMMEPYTFALVHALMSAVIAAKCGMDDRTRSKLISAALVANIAYLPHLPDFNRSKETLSNDQRLILRRHPEMSCDLCTKAGITDPEVLEIILSHHERRDGDGYPKGTRDVPDSAIILYTAERYVALISERNYRNSYSIDKARLLIEHDIKSAHIYEAFCAAIPRFAPGLLVSLQNGDVAIIKTSKPLEVYSLADNHMNAYEKPVKVNLQDNNYQIADIFKADKSTAAQLANAVWGA